MFDLNNMVPFAGTAGTRGIEGARILRELNETSGRFEQNGIEIIVYQDSTERELMWQCQAKSQNRSR